jgi:hypothetical protein
MARLIPKGMLAASFAAICGTIVFNTFPLFIGFTADKFALSDIEIGVVGSSFMAAYSLLTLSSLVWLGRIRWKPAATIAVAIALLALLGIARSSDYVPLLIVVAVLGAASSVPQLIANAWIDGAPEPDTLFGIKGVIDLSAAALAIIALVVIFEEANNWSLLIVYACVLLVSLFAATRISATHQSHQLSVITGSATGWAALCVLGLHSVAMVGFWSFAERIGNDIEASSSSISMIMSAAMIVGILGAATAGFLAYRFGLRRSVVVLYAGVLVSIALFAYGESLAGYAIAVLSFQFAWICLNVLQIAFVADADNHGGLVAIASVGVTAGGALGPTLAGMTRTSAGNGGLYTLVVLTTILCAFLTWRIARTLDAR